MTAQVQDLISTAIVAFGLVLFGLIGTAAKNWITTSVLKWPSREDQTRAAFKDVLEKHEQYKANARIVCKRAVDKWIAMWARQVRALMEDGACGYDQFDVEDTSDRVDLIGESARYMQVELYMSSLDANGWERKSDLEWSALCESLFASISTATLEYYRTRFKSKVVTWRHISDKMMEESHEFREEFNVCMSALKALSKEYHAVGGGKSK